MKSNECNRLRMCHICKRAHMVRLVLGDQDIVVSCPDSGRSYKLPYLR